MSRRGAHSPYFESEPVSNAPRVKLDKKIGNLNKDIRGEN